MKRLLLLLALLISSTSWAGIPATPVMTLYRFNGALHIPYYSSKNVSGSGVLEPAGTLAQGSAVVPCIVVDDGLPLTDSKGVPYVGFQVVMDSRRATPASVAPYKKAVKQRQTMTVANHHCEGDAPYVFDVRRLYEMTKAPFFDPPPRTKINTAVTPAQGELDQIVRAFHNSPLCANVNRHLTGRRGALAWAWERFIREQKNRWSESSLERAKHLDYTMRTAIFEGHLERGCNAYGACERNIIALTIRNRALESCVRRQGCEAPGDFQGVASSVSQYNIWDEYLTQISGLTSCFLRDDLAGDRKYNKLQSMYEQNLDDVQRILFGNDQDLAEIFPNNSLSDLKKLKHYYHAPAMGKCFPGYDRVEYMSGAVARRGNSYALLANTRIWVDEKMDGGYFFRDFVVREEPARDVITLVDNYPGFVVDEKRVTLRAPSRCAPYGIPNGCQLSEIGRYRKTPFWINSGKPLELKCRIADQGTTCQEKTVLRSVKVGGVCDTQMRPVTGVK